MVLYSRTREINTASVAQRISSVGRGDPLGGSPYSTAIVPRLSFDVSRSKRRTATCHHSIALALRLLLRDCLIRLAVRLLLRDGLGREGTCLLLREIPEFPESSKQEAYTFPESGK